MNRQSQTFVKFLTPTDVGETGAKGGRSKQSGIDVRVHQVSALPPLDESAANPESFFTAIDNDGISLPLRFVHFNNQLRGGTRNVYRITGIGEYLRSKRSKSGDRLTLVRNLNGSYQMSLSPGQWQQDISDTDDDAGPSDDDPFERVKRGVRLRRGQSAFRKTMMRLYDHSCAISGWGPEDVLEAAHIEPHSVGGHNSADNGLLLRADLHTLMDAGLLLIDPRNLQILVHDKLIGTEYEQYAGNKLRARTDSSSPDQKFLEDRFLHTVREQRDRFKPIKPIRSA
jgi:hypothetical protein